MINVTVSGCNGRMGSRIKRLVIEDPELNLVGAFDIEDDAKSAIEMCDVLVEFTTPEATVKNLKIARELGKAAVIGTTGLDEKQSSFVKDSASKIPIVFSPNMAVGVNMLFKITGELSLLLDESYLPSISETHHIHKKDAPSGTAKRIRDIICKNRGVVPDRVKVDSQRIGDVIGDHTVIFDAKDERLEITHRAKSRDVFAKGAIVAAKFVVKKKNGLFTMQEVLGISK